jgi:hypothetical protein
MDSGCAVASLRIPRSWNSLLACHPSWEYDEVQLRLASRTIFDTKGKKMRTVMRLSAFAVLAAMSRLALAQQLSGYNVTWGMQPVPISPWAGATIGLLLLLAAYAFLRRHAGQGLFMLATAALVGGLVLHTVDTANAVAPFYSITTPTGSDFYSCISPPSYGGYQNNTGAPIRLTLAPVGLSVSSVPQGTASPSTVLVACHVGDQQLPANGGSCYMPCGA